MKTHGFIVCTNGIIQRKKALVNSRVGPLLVPVDAGVKRSNRVPVYVSVGTRIDLFTLGGFQFKIRMRKRFWVGSIGMISRRAIQ